jgi:hypothetical protein
VASWHRRFGDGYAELRQQGLVRRGQPQPRQQAVQLGAGKLLALVRAREVKGVRVGHRLS